jgi:predicted acyltransferase
MESTAAVPVIAPAADDAKVNKRQPYQRLASLDVYRGFVMLLMMAEVLNFRRVARALPNSEFWAFLYFHQDHVEWVGCSLHDLIQPSFSFLVGVALPFSLANRLAKGISKSALVMHALIRAFILIILGIFLRSMSASQTNFTFEDTLTQIGLGYPFLFLLGFTSRKMQLLALVILLIGYWAAFAMYPLPSADFNYALAGVPPDYPHNMTGFAAHWNKNTNLAWAFDRWFLNLFPREKPFSFNDGGYTTLSFIPTLGTMILGLFAGNKLQENLPAEKKINHFLITGLVLLGVGLLFHITGINPIVKRIWTPAWTLFSGGCCFVLLSIFYYVIDMKQRKKWSFILMIIGMNSIAAYVIAHVLPDFIDNTFAIHLGKGYDQLFGPAYATLVSGTLILVVEILILYWMYKRKIFIKV